MPAYKSSFCFVFIFFAGFFATQAGCTGRKIGSDDFTNDALPDGSSNNHYPDGSTLGDSGNTPIDGSLLPDGLPPDGNATQDCDPQEIYCCIDPCANIVGAWWDGQFCQPIICCCEGPDCAQTYDDPASCLAAHTNCDLNACAATGGYCEYGDSTLPTCWPGYGKDYTATAQDPDVCGLGVCCVPCPDPDDPNVGYVSMNPEQCQQLDWVCGAGAYSFDNECGCGCIQLKANR